MSITKAHLADSIYNRLGLPKNQSVKVLESILEIFNDLPAEAGRLLWALTPVKTEVI